MTKFYLILILIAFSSAVSQVLLNISAKKEYSSKIFEYLNIYVISSYMLLFIFLIVNIFILKYVDVKNANAIISAAYFFAMILSKIFLGEKITGKKVIGNLMIVIGIIVFLI